MAYTVSWSTCDGYTCSSRRLSDRSPLVVLLDPGLERTSDCDFLKLEFPHDASLLAPAVDFPPHQVLPGSGLHSSTRMAGRHTATSAAPISTVDQIMMFIPDVFLGVRPLVTPMIRKHRAIVAVMQTAPIAKMKMSAVFSLRRSCSVLSTNSGRSVTTACQYVSDIVAGEAGTYS